MAWGIQTGPYTRHMCFGLMAEQTKGRAHLLIRVASHPLIRVASHPLISKGVPGGPSGPSREGPGVRHKIVSDTKKMTKERKKKGGKGKNV